MGVAKEYKGICARCAHRNGCQTPCAPVQRELYVRGRPREKVRGETVTVLSKSREIQNSVLEAQIAAKLPSGDTTRGGPLENATETIWAQFDFDPKTKRTGIFVDRFFARWSWGDIATRYDTTTKDARRVYYEAKARLFKIIQRMDRSTRLGNIAQIEKTSGRLDQKTRAFVLCKCLDLTPAEVGELLGVNDKKASKWIRSCADQIRKGKDPIRFEGSYLEGRAATPSELGAA